MPPSWATNPDGLSKTRLSPGAIRLKRRPPASCVSDARSNAGIVAPQAQSKAALAVQVPMASPHVAARLGEKRDDVGAQTGRPHPGRTLDPQIDSRAERSPMLTRTRPCPSALGSTTPFAAHFGDRARLDAEPAEAGHVADDPSPCRSVTASCCRAMRPIRLTRRGLDLEPVRANVVRQVSRGADMQDDKHQSPPGTAGNYAAACRATASSRRSFGTKIDSSAHIRHASGRICLFLNRPAGSESQRNVKRFCGAELTRGPNRAKADCGGQLQARWSGMGDRNCGKRRVGPQYYATRWTCGTPPVDLDVMRQVRVAVARHLVRGRARHGADAIGREITGTKRAPSDICL